MKQYLVPEKNLGKKYLVNKVKLTTNENNFQACLKAISLKNYLAKPYVTKSLHASALPNNWKKYDKIV